MKKVVVTGGSGFIGSNLAVEHMLYAAKAYSLIHGSDYVIPDHVKVEVPKGWDKT